MNKRYHILKNKPIKAGFGDLFPEKTQTLKKRTTSGTMFPDIEHMEAPEPQFSGGTNQGLINTLNQPSSNGLQNALAQPAQIQSSTRALENVLPTNLGGEEVQQNGDMMTSLVDTSTKIGGDVLKDGLGNIDGNTLKAGAGMAGKLATMGTDALFNKAIEKNASVDGFGNKVTSDKAKKLGIAQAGIGSAVSTFGSTMATTGNPLIAGGAALVSGLVSTFGAKKKLKAEQEAQDKALVKNKGIYGRSEDAQMTAMLSKRGKKLGSFTMPSVKSKTLVMKTGGKLAAPGEINVVVSGKMHRENNNLGNKDKGIPVINETGVKEYEVETGEIIFRQEATQKIEEYITEYDKSKDTGVFEDLGKYLSKELLKNTQDNYGKFGVKVKA